MNWLTIWSHADTALIYLTDMVGMSHVMSMSNCHVTPLSVFNVSTRLKYPLTLNALSQIPCTRVSSFNLLKWHYKISTLYMCTFFFFLQSVAPSTNIPLCKTNYLCWDKSLQSLQFRYYHRVLLLRCLALATLLEFTFNTHRSSQKSAY